MTFHTRFRSDTITAHITAFEASPLFVYSQLALRFGLPGDPGIVRDHKVFRAMYDPASVPPAARELARQALAHIQQGCLTDAEYCLQQALLACPHYLDACFTLGWVYYHQKRFQQAVACYRQA